MLMFDTFNTFAWFQVSFGVVVAWAGSPPDLSQLNRLDSGFESHDQGFKLLLESVYSNLFHCEEGGKEDEQKIGDVSWFVVSGSTSVDNSGKVGLFAFSLFASALNSYSSHR